MSGGADVLEILEICAHYLVNAFPPFYPGFWIYVCEGDVSVVTVSIFFMSAEPYAVRHFNRRVFSGGC